MSPCLKSVGTLAIALLAGIQSAEARPSSEQHSVFSQIPSDVSSDLTGYGVYLAAAESTFILSEWLFENGSGGFAEGFSDEDRRTQAPEAHPTD